MRRLKLARLVKCQIEEEEEEDMFYSNQLEHPKVQLPRNHEGQRQNMYYCTFVLLSKP
jgi:hypothetical protein